MSFENAAFVVGAGFSANASVPPTGRISPLFLRHNRPGATPAYLQRKISVHLRKYWAEVFGYRSGRNPPTFEDHFTLLDLAANSGHNLGQFYTPTRLRSIRRMSIHRVFDIIDTFKWNKWIDRLVHSAASGPANKIISTNWDIVTENHVRSVPPARYNYGIEMLELSGRLQERVGLEIIKLHGSTNWHYCDACRQIVCGMAGEGKTALHHWTFVEPEDFARLGDSSRFVRRVTDEKKYRAVECPECHAQLTARVATFSYSKAFDFFQFRASWDRALRHLSQAEEWIFIGYSLPEADFELRHMLKTAQLANRYGPRIRVVLDQNRPAIRRYTQFFGKPNVEIIDCGFETWAAAVLP